MFKKTAVYLAALTSIMTMPDTFASASSTVEIKVATTASCALTLPDAVDLGDIPFTAFDGLKAGTELTGYNTDFKIGTVCHGTNKFRLEFLASRLNYNCLTADTVSGGMGFCLYHGDTHIQLANSQLRRVETEGEETVIRVVPLRLDAPTPGTHSGTLTVTITPL